MRTMMKQILNYFPIMVIVFVALSSLCILFSRLDVATDYTKTIVVDDSAKVEQALSNAVNLVHSRNFIIVKINVKKRLRDGYFIIKCSGIDRENLLSN